MSGIYDGALTREQFMFLEMRKVAQMTIQGMTEEEIVKYIAQVAFSGATDFITKYAENDKGEGAGIIGHFGLGFYSAFMAASEVEIDTLSYTHI